MLYAGWSRVDYSGSGLTGILNAPTERDDRPLPLCGFGAPVSALRDRVFFLEVGD